MRLGLEEGQKRERRKREVRGGGGGGRGRGKRVEARAERIARPGGESGGGEGGTTYDGKRVKEGEGRNPPLRLHWTWVFCEGAERAGDRWRTQEEEEGGRP